MASAKITLTVLVAGLSFLLIGVGLIGTLIGVRATLEHFSSLTIGLIMSGYYLGYILGTFVVPGYIRHVGHIRTFSALAAVATASTLSFGLILDPWAWGGLRIISGIAVVGLYMTVESWLNQQTATAWRGRVFGLYIASTLGALAAGQFLLLLADPAGTGLFLVAAIFIVLGVVPITLNRLREPDPITPVKTQLLDLYRISPLAFQGALIAGVVSSAFWGMGAVYAQGLGLNTAEIASFIASIIIGGAALQWPIGLLSDRFDRRLVLVSVSLSGAVLAFAAQWLWQSSLPILVSSAFVYGGLLFALYSLSVAHANDHLQTEQVLEATRGLLLIYGLGAIIGPAAVGLVMNQLGNSGLTWFSSAFLLLLGVFGLYRMSQRQAPSESDQGHFVAMVRTTPAALDLHPQLEIEADNQSTKPSLSKR